MYRYFRLNEIVLEQKYTEYYITSPNISILSDES